MKRIYLDTSVFGGYFEPEFQLWTKILFEKIIRGEFVLLFSELTNAELQGAPQKVKDLILKIPGSQIELVELGENAQKLGELYVTENVVGKTSLADCVHIALATLTNADILASWNFKHIVNINRIRGVQFCELQIGTYPIRNTYTKRNY